MELANLRKGVVTAEVLLMALIEQKDSIVLKVLDELREDTGALRATLIDRIMIAIQELPDFSFSRVTSLTISEDVRNMFEEADHIRNHWGDSYISTAGLFLACFSERVPTTRALLHSLGLSADSVEAAIKALRGNAKISQKDGESRQSVLEEYTTDVTAMARRKELDPVIGRGDEVNQVIQILSRRKKNNPILIGEPGVGKTVIVEGLANQIAAADVPEYLLNKRILSLEMGVLIAGAKMQGEFEERLKNIMDEVINSAGDVILFIDEIHTVVGAGRSGGSLDASNMLKPALARGLLRCIGATTNKEYKQYIESDKALARRFQPVKVGQPSVEDTFNILLGIRERYQKHHHIEYTDEALKAAAELSARDSQDRFLPDKAIDFIDEAGAAKRLQVIYTPPNIRQLETKRHDLLNKKAQAFNEQDFERMAQFQMDLARLEQDLSDQMKEFSATIGDKDRQVDVDEIAQLVSKKTGVPARRMVQEEAQRLLNLEHHLRSRVIGQSHAIDSVANAIRRNRAGLRQRSAPIASFLFLGPTGVGKTELAKAIAAEMLDDESKIIRIDMSEYMQSHEVAKLIGSPPGYVGYGEGGQLTEQVRQNPYSVVLFDEFEKAHPDVYNLLLQVLDEGWLTDSEGQKVSFRNCVIIGTSNIGSEILTDRKRPVGLGAQNELWDQDNERRAIMKEVQKYLRPEFINRVDEIIVFNRLSYEELSRILDIQIEDLRRRLMGMGLELKFTDAAKTYVMNGIDTLTYGARPLRRRLEVTVENEIANLLIAASEGKPNCVLVDTEGNELKVSKCVV